MTIAFFGLGNMGFPIAANLLKAGHSVRSFVHKNADAPRRLQALGGSILPTAEEALQGADMIFTIVPNDDALRGLLCCPAMLQAAKPGAVLVEMTSASAQAVQEISAYYAPKGIQVLDAPVSGGVAGATAGTMTMICSGEKAAFDAALPVLECISQNRFYIGERLGDAKKLKSINNLMSAANMAMMGEGWKLAKANGISADDFYRVVCASSGCSSSFKNGFPKVAADELNAKFTVALMRKDIGLAMQLADGQQLPLSQTTYEYYKQAVPYDDLDQAAVAKVDFHK